MEIMTVDFARAHIKQLQEVCALRATSATIAELASCYFTLNEPEKALSLAQKAWELNRKDSGVALNLGMILKDLGKHEESFKVIEQAYFLNPDDFYAQLGYSEAMLRAGLWKQAWPLYDNCRPTQQGAANDLRLPYTVREWDGSEISEGHELLVINEGGTGDRFSYARWLPELTKRGVNWKFYPYDELFPFFERIFPREKLVENGVDDINPTHWVTTFALPAKLNIGPMEIPPPLPITASENSIAKYPVRKTDNLPVIGLCYEAAEMHQGGKKIRSLSEGQAMRLVCQTADRVHWINLQYKKPMPYPVINVVDLETWEDTAGLIHNLDGVVTVDTGVMHLAGAMNKPMAVLLPANSCWKFLLNRTKLPLYPSATFFRNETQGFEQSISKLVTAIRSNGSVVPKIF